MTDPLPEYHLRTGRALHLMTCLPVLLLLTVITAVGLVHAGLHGVALVITDSSVVLAAAHAVVLWPRRPARERHVEPGEVLRQA